MYKIPSGAHYQYAAKCTGPYCQLQKNCRLATARGTINIQKTKTVDTVLFVLIRYTLLDTSNGICLLRAPSMLPILWPVESIPLLTKTFIRGIVVALQNASIQQEIRMLLLLKAPNALIAHTTILQITHR